MNLQTFLDIYEKMSQKCDSLEDIKKLQFNFTMIYIIHEILVLLKITAITLKLLFSDGLLRSIINFQLF